MVRVRTELGQKGAALMYETSEQHIAIEFGDHSISLQWEPSTLALLTFIFIEELSGCDVKESSGIGEETWSRYYG